MKETKNSMVTRSIMCAFGRLNGDLKILNLRSRNQIVENYIILENSVTSEGVVSHNVLYYQPLPFTQNQERI